jgi:DmsE family decaheme c-type cytochrome
MAQESAAPGNAAPPAPAIVCTECHAKVVDVFLTSAKGKLFLLHPRTEAEKGGCTTCHGATGTHVSTGGEDPGTMISFGRKDRTAVNERNAICLNCHERTARLFWKGSAHDTRDVGCTGCHALMTENSPAAHLKKPTVTETCAQCHPQRAAQQMRASHMPLREGRLECTNCHNPHGSANDKLLKAASVNEACYGCHAEKRGPFLWEHAPVAENCANCHDSHGSNHEKMLKTPKPRLCQQCHDETQHPTQPQLPTGTRFVLGRQCTNCHFNIHGSNHPSGQAFTR